MDHTKRLIEIKDLRSPKGHFLLGHLPQFNVPNKHQVLERWVEECGELFKINFVGKTFIVSAQPELNNEILKQRPEQFRRFSKITEILEEMGVLGVFNAEGDTWKRHRKPTSEALNLKKVRNFYPIISKKTALLIEKWKTYADLASPFDVQKEFMRYTVDITTSIAFGYEMDTINNKDDDFQRHLERIFPMINERITAPLPLWRLMKRKKDKNLDRSLQEIEKIVYHFIDKAKERIESEPALKENPTNFLEALLVEQEKKERFNDKEIYGNVFSMLLAGEDTTSNSLSWALFYLAQHPEMVNKTRKEAQEVYGGATVPLSNAELGQLTYANAIAQEAIRLKPVTPNLYFQANEDVEINDFRIPKNTTLMLQNKVAQTDDDYFSNPNAFIPERWIKNGCPMHEHHQPDIIRAFGSGPRFCPGKNLAMHEMTIAISSICKHFDLEMVVKPEEVIEQFAFTMYPKNLRIKLINH
jgi:cytochrome P450